MRFVREFRQESGNEQCTVFMCFIKFYAFAFPQSLLYVCTTGRITIMCTSVPWPLIAIV